MEISFQSFDFGIKLCVKTLSLKKIGKWSVIFLLYFYLYIYTVHITKIEKNIINNTGFVMFCKPSWFKYLWCEPVTCEYIKKFIYFFFLPKFSRLMFKSPVNITFLFSLQSALRVYFKYHKNSVSFCFGCLYTTPTTKFSLLVCMISIQCALYSLWELEHFLVSLTTDHLLHYNKVLQQIIYCFWYKIHNHLLTLSLVYPHSFGSQLRSVPTRW